MPLGDGVFLSLTSCGEVSQIEIEALRDEREMMVGDEEIKESSQPRTKGPKR